MTPTTFTALFLIATIMFVGIYDVYAAYFLGSAATVSATVQRWGQNFPILTLLIGLVIGHIFWPTIPPDAGVSSPPVSTGPPK